MQGAPRRSLVWLIVVVSLLPLALLAFVAVDAATDAVQRQARARVEASAAVSEQYVVEQVRGFERLVESYARRPSLIDALGTGDPSTYEVAELDRQVGELAGSRIGTHVVGILDVRGVQRSIAPSAPTVIGRDFSFRDYYRGVISTGTTYVSEAYRTAALDRPLVVAVATPVRAKDGTMLGIIAATLNIQETQRFVKRFAAAQGVSLMVTDQRGVPIASKGGALSSLRSRTRDPRVKRALEGRRGIVEVTDDDGASVLSAYRPIPDFGWTVSASVPADTAWQELAPLRMLVLGSAALLGAILLTGLVALLRVRRRYEVGLHAKVSDLEAANRQLAATNRTLDAFSHTLAHDLRNPLTTIGGFAHALRHLAGDEDRRVQEMARHIEESAQRMEQLIADVLELATLARPMPERTLVEPAAIVREAIADIEALDAELDWLPERILANRTLLYRSFKNLLENASLYGHAPGERPKVRISATESSTEWQFFFDDAGPGVSDVDKGRIFTAFQRGLQSADHAGTGLGLAIVTACAEAHGGSITVEDSPTSRGARFTLSIAKPTSDAEAGTPEG